MYHQQTVAVSGQPQAVITQVSPRQDDDKFGPSSLGQMAVLSVIQVCMGGLCVLFGIILLAIRSGDTDQGSEVAYIGYGIWIGLLYVLVGGLGIGAWKQNKGGMIVAAMVLNIICSCCWCFLLVGFASASLAITSVNSCRSYWYYSYTQSNCDEGVTRTFNALDSLMLLMALAEFVITIWSAALCCGAVCRCCKPSQVGTVVYYNGQPAVTTVHQSHQMAFYPSVPQQGYYGNGQMMQVQGQYSQPAGVHTYNTGYHMPQGPPTYQSVVQGPPAQQQQPAPYYPSPASGSNPGYAQQQPVGMNK